MQKFIIIHHPYIPFPLFFDGARWIAIGNSTYGCWRFPMTRSIWVVFWQWNSWTLTGTNANKTKNSFLKLLTLLFCHLGLCYLCHFLVFYVLNCNFYFGPLLCIILPLHFSITLNLWSVIMGETCSVAIHAHVLWYVHCYYDQSVLQIQIF